MPKKKLIKKDHITATIDPELSDAISAFRDDGKNAIENEKPARSYIISMALTAFLQKYIKKKPLSPIPSNSVTVTSIEGVTEHDRGTTETGIGS